MNCFTDQETQENQLIYGRRDAISHRSISQLINSSKVLEKTHRYANIMCEGVRCCCCSCLQRRSIRSAALTTLFREQAGISIDAMGYVMSVSTNSISGKSQSTNHQSLVVQLPAQSQSRTTWQRMSRALQPGIHGLYTTRQMGGEVSLLRQRLLN